MKVLFTGAAGQLGPALIAARPEGVQLLPCRRQELDLSDQDACRRLVREHQPDWVLNAGAYTAVDRAESEAELAHAVNALAPAALAEAQAEQLAQAEAALDVFQRFEAPEYSISDSVGPGALVEAEVDGDLSFFFLAPTGGGLTTDFLGCELTVITPDSRLYQSLADKKMGDSLDSPALTIMGLE